VAVSPLTSLLMHSIPPMSNEGRTSHLLIRFPLPHTLLIDSIATSFHLVTISWTVRDVWRIARRRSPCYRSPAVSRVSNLSSSTAYCHFDASVLPKLTRLSINMVSEETHLWVEVIKSASELTDTLQTLTSEHHHTARDSCNC